MPQAKGNRILSGEEADKKIKAGIDLLELAVGSTLGPRGRNVGINNGPESLVLHDGVKVATFVITDDPGINFGINVLRQAANKQVDQVGDGTTVVTVLGHAIVTEAKKVTTAGVNPMELVEDLKAAAELVVKDLDANSKKIKTLEEKIQVATISAEDAELGKIIGETLDKLGEDAVITVEDSKGLTTYIEHQEGMQFDKGYISQYFVTNGERMEATVEDTLILLTDKTIHNVTELVPLFEKMAAAGRKNLVIIAEDVVDTALSVCAGTKISGKLNILAVRSPLFGEQQKAMLEDIAVLTKGEVITKESGKKIENAEITQLGVARRVTATKDATLIVDPAGEKEAIENRVKSIKAEIDRNEGSEFQIEKLKERIAKLGAGVAVLKVGGHTEVEMQERKERAIDAVLSTKAALEAGVVAGGETAYLKARRVLLPEVNKRNIAYTILYEALAQPFKKLTMNAGLEPGNALAMLSFEEAPNMGYDVTDKKIKDMLKAGIIDAVKICTCAVNNAVSVAIALITTKVIIVPIVSKEDETVGT